MRSSHGRGAPVFMCSSISSATSFIAASVTGSSSLSARAAASGDDSETSLPTFLLSSPLFCASAKGTGSISPSHPGTAASGSSTEVT